MANKYVIGKDEYGNSIYNWTEVAHDMKKVIWGKKKFSKALYEVMVMRFTIAHYNLAGWVATYEKNWAALAREIELKMGWVDATRYERDIILPDLVGFLKENNDMPIWYK